MVVGLEKVVFREGNFQGNRELAIVRRNLKQTWLNLANNDSISSKVIRTQTKQFLELFSATELFLRLKDVKLLFYIIDRARLF